MLGISRASLDHELLRFATTCGAQLLQPARCEGLNERHVIVRDLTTNARRMIDTSFILLADGKAALMPNRPIQTGDLGIKAHFTNVDGPGDAIELFGVRGHYGGLAPIEGHRWNASFSVPAARVQEFGGDLDALFDRIVDDNPKLCARMRGAGRVGHWLAAPLPRHAVERKWPDHVIPLGNAAAAVEPVGGEGIGLAMRSAELAAEEIIRAARDHDEVNVSRLRRAFEQLWQPRRATCRALALALSSPALARWAVPMIASSDPPARLAMHLIGK
jgi:2-polyprenyl-6-methoxyphenol hydroxylase-like FAD-dependent oxidoreductase